jgi:hypothetical protein
MFNQNSMNHQPNPARDGQKRRSAFTLIELAVVIATLAILVTLVLPALAGVQNKGGRMQCANNLRQIGIGSMIYAGEYRGWLPICSIGGVNSYPNIVNNLGGMHYTRYVFSSDFSSPNSKVSTNATLSSYQNLGYLYRVGIIGNANVFFCPDQWGTLLGADYYSPLLTTDAGGIVRSSYAFNPRIVNPTNNVIARRYQKASDLQPHKLLAVDYFDTGVFAHFRERGWNVLFSDGSVQFSRNDLAYNLVKNFSVSESVSSYIMEDQILNYLELDH